MIRMGSESRRRRKLRLCKARQQGQAASDVVHTHLSDKLSTEHQPTPLPEFLETRWNWPTFDPEGCQECGCTIPLHETAWLLNDDIFCEHCCLAIEEQRASRERFARTLKEQREEADEAATEIVVVEAPQAPARRDHHHLAPSTVPVRVTTDRIGSLNEAISLVPDVAESSTCATDRKSNTPLPLPRIADVPVRHHTIASNSMMASTEQDQPPAETIPTPELNPGAQPELECESERPAAHIADHTAAHSAEDFPPVAVPSDDTNCEIEMPVGSESKADPVDETPTISDDTKKLSFESIAEDLALPAFTTDASTEIPSNTKTDTDAEVDHDTGIAATHDTCEERDQPGEFAILNDTIAEIASVIESYKPTAPHQFNAMPADCRDEPHPLDAIPELEIDVPLPLDSDATLRNECMSKATALMDHWLSDSPDSKSSRCA